jgi:type IV pilus assembly protein PilV
MSRTAIFEEQTVARTYAAGRRRDGGFTLVEILVTLLIASIGLLGIAALHSFSLRNNYDALMRSHASALASDIADRMRANADEVNAVSDYWLVFGQTKTVTPGSSQALADVVEWEETLGEQLPNGDGQIQFNAATRVVSISVRWGERGTDMTFRTDTEI